MENGCQCSMQDRNFFWLHGVAYGIVDPQIGTESTPLALEAWSQQLDLPESVMDFLFF